MEIDEAFKRYATYPKPTPPPASIAPATPNTVVVARQAPQARTWTSLFLTAGMFASMSAGGYVLAKVIICYYLSLRGPHSRSCRKAIPSSVAEKFARAVVARQRNVSAIRPWLQRAIVWVLDTDVLKQTESAKLQAIEAAEIAARRHIKDLHRDQDSSMQSLLKALEVNKEEVRQEVKQLMTSDADVKGLQDSCVALMKQVKEMQSKIDDLEEEVADSRQAAEEAAAAAVAATAVAPVAAHENGIEEQVAASEEIRSSRSLTEAEDDNGLRTGPAPVPVPASSSSISSQGGRARSSLKQADSARTSYQSPAISPGQGSAASSVTSSHKKKGKIYERMQMFEQGMSRASAAT